MSNLSRGEKKALNELFDSLKEKREASWKIISIKRVIIDLYLGSGIVRKLTINSNAKPNKNLVL